MEKDLKKYNNINHEHKASGKQFIHIWTYGITKFILFHEITKWIKIKSLELVFWLDVLGSYSGAKRYLYWAPWNPNQRRKKKQKISRTNDGTKRWNGHKTTENKREE